jgi:hypothetical protein
MTGFFLAGAAVSLLQYLRVRDPRILLLVVLFAARGLAHFVGEATRKGVAADLLSGCAGLALLFWLSPRAPHPPAR